MNNIKLTHKENGYTVIEGSYIDPFNDGPLINIPMRVEVLTYDYKKWLNGTFAQDAFYYLTVETKENF